MSRSPYGTRRAYGSSIRATGGRRTDSHDSIAGGQSPSPAALEVATSSQRLQVLEDRGERKSVAGPVDTVVGARVVPGVRHAGLRGVVELRPGLAGRARVGDETDAAL